MEKDKKRYLYIENIIRESTSLIDKFQAFAIEFPKQKIVICNHLLITGWVIGKKSPVVNVEVLENSQVRGITSVNIPRLDVSKHYQDSQAKWIKNCGFLIVVELKEIESKPEITIQGVLEDKIPITLAKVQYSFKSVEELAKSELDLTAQINQARIMLRFNKMKEVKVACQLARLQTSKLPWEYYSLLGDYFHKSNQFDQAIAAYKKALKLAPDNPYLYLNAANFYFEKDQIDCAIESYQKAIKLKPDLPFTFYKKLSYCLNLEGKKEEAATLLKSSPLPKGGEVYSKIWQSLNQTSLETLEVESANYPIKIKLEEVEQYFNQKKIDKYKTIYLRSLSEEDKNNIESIGISLNYLKLNQEELITSTRVAAEDTGYIPKSHKLSFETARRLNDLAFRTQYQISMIDEGYINVVCPYTGEILRSNSSSILFNRNSFCYRFVGKEVFYLITGGDCNEKVGFYFPNTELIIYLAKNIVQLERLINEQMLNHWKAHLVSCWQDYKSYLSNRNQVETAAIVGLQPYSTAHHLWNDLSGIQKVYEAGLLQKIDKFIVVVQEFYGGIEEIFPEIPADKIRYIPIWQEQEEIIDNNYFALRLSDIGVTENLAKRISKVSLKKCSADFLATVEAAKQNHFPLLWINFRLGKRTWLSQVEGIANIIKNLAKEFPNLGVVFDGCSRIDVKGKLLVNEGLEKTIREEKEILCKIQALLPPHIKIYDIVGSPMHEVLVWAKAIDLYFAPFGGGLAKTIFIANKPGVIHTNTFGTRNFCSQRHNYYSLKRENSLTPVYVPECYITDAPEDKFSKRDPINTSYECDWKGAYEELLKMILSLDNNRE